jgi:hypothetical protein
MHTVPNQPAPASPLIAFALFSTVIGAAWLTLRLLCALT